MKNIRVTAYNSNLTLFVMKDIEGLGNVNPTVKLYKDQTIAVPAVYKIDVNDLKELALGLLQVADFIEACQAIGEIVEEVETFKTY